MLIRLLPLAGLILASQAFADWRLNPETSSVHFLSTKKSHVTEIHHFKSLTGHISDAGEATLNIDLASAETGIPIRNERLQTLLFNLSDYPSAEISLTLDKTQLKQLKKGHSQQLTLEATLTLNGVSKNISAQVIATGLAKQHIQVTSIAPILINAKTFNLAPGVEALREIAKLDAISLSVPVTFNLYYQAN